MPALFEQYRMHVSCSILSLAVVAAENNYVRPVLTTERRIEIVCPCLPIGRAIMCKMSSTDVQGFGFEQYSYLCSSAPLECRGRVQGG